MFVPSLLLVLCGIVAASSFSAEQRGRSLDLSKRDVVFTNYTAQRNGPPDPFVRDYNDWDVTFSRYRKPYYSWQVAERISFYCLDILFDEVIISPPYLSFTSTLSE